MARHLRTAFGWVFSGLIAYAGAIVFETIGFPLPWMLGPLFVFAVFAFFRLEPLGLKPGFPAKSRLFFIPVVGVMIGARVTPEIFAEVARWWPSLLLVLPYMVVVQFLNAAILRRVGGYDAPTAFFAASPGGMVEAVLIGEANGGNGPLMAIQHFARVTLAVTTIPVLLSFELGAPVGSAAGVTGADHAGALGLTDFVLLLLAGVIGAVVAVRLRIPAGIMVGPLLLSGALHAGGLTEAQIPEVLLQTAQLVIGVTLGSRFAGPSKTDLLRGLGLSLLTLSCTLALAFLSALLVTQLGLAGTMVSFIAFAPGGLVEMGLIAISLDADPIFVATHHVFRIALAVTVAPLLFRLAYPRRAP